MPYSAEAIANEFIRTAKASGKNISPMKLQKLVYYAHGWNLAITQEPLIEEQVQAWKYGPVIPILYHEFKEYGNGEITSECKELDYDPVKKLCFPYSPDIRRETSDADEIEYADTLIKKMWELYGHYSPIQLSRMTHEDGTPWHQVASQYNLDPPPGLNIPNELIQEYFANKLTKKAS